MKILKVLIHSLIITVILLLNFSKAGVCPNNNLFCFLKNYNNLYLFDLKQQKLIKKQELNDYYESVFFISKDKLVFQKQDRIAIIDVNSINKEAEFGFKEQIKNIKVLSENDRETNFIVFTRYSLKLFNYRKDNKSIKLVLQTELSRFFDFVVKNNQIYVANNLFISIFKISNFFGFRFISRKNIKMDHTIYSLDISSNKYVILHYLSSIKRRLSFYTLSGLEMKRIELEGNYHKIWFDFEEKEIVLYDKSNIIRLAKIDGSVRESNVFENEVVYMDKFSDGFILVLNDKEPQFIVLSKNFNTL
ncbi:MAG: hypothetical protein ABDH21_02820 [bacterium]